jgi:hypothetical protein
VYEWLVAGLRRLKAAIAIEKRVVSGWIMAVSFRF